MMGTASSAVTASGTSSTKTSGVYREKSTGKRKQPEAREYKHDFLEKLRQNQLPTDEAKMEPRPSTRPVDGIPCSDTTEGIGGGRADSLPPS